MSQKVTSERSSGDLERSSISIFQSTKLVRLAYDLLFEIYLSPNTITVMTNRGTAYILYYDPADAEAAIAHMHEAQLDGAILNVSIVLPRRKFSRSPPTNRMP